MTDQEADHDFEQGSEEASPWVPPTSLPAPAAQKSGPPLLGIAAGLGAVVVCSVALWGGFNTLYFYILFNALVGGAIGWGLGLAATREGFRNTAVLTGLAVVFCALPYLLCRVLFYLQLAEDGVSLLGCLGFLVVLTQNDRLFGVEVGVIGNLVIIGIEIAISVHAARTKIVAAVGEAVAASVPGEVVAFVVNGLAQGWTTSDLKRELAERGWRNAADQDRAIGTGFDVVAAMRAQAAAE